MTLNEILKQATQEHWATGHFNFSESDQARAICEAANEARTCAILGTSEGEAKHLGYFQAVALRDAFRKEFGVPIFLNADHHKSVEAAKTAIDAGYDSIHIDLSALSFEDNVAGTEKIVEYAKQVKSDKLPVISVEGELGYLRGESKIQNEKIEVRPEDYTDPEQAADFVRRTGVDRLAIAVGNIHGISLNEPTLDIERIKQIRTAVPDDVALVLHAGSGIPDDQIKAAITAGIANIHINTELRVAYTQALKDEFQKDPSNVIPYKYDASAREAMKTILRQKLQLFGAANRI
ncbi:MAG TPA: class II fructose-bisphosphate aldolase [Candidatus Paceibacterota bacterium]